MAKQKGKGMKRKRGWHRSKRSATHFEEKLKRIEQAEKPDSKESDSIGHTDT